MAGEMVRAILEGRKTQTRRIIKPQPYEDAKWGTVWEPRGKKPHSPSYSSRNVSWSPITEAFWDYYRNRGGTPYGVAGDRLWVRETWFDVRRWERETGLRSGVKENAQYRADFDLPVESRVKWKPSIHMPRWASRITLEITKVRVERLQDISESDARAEGVHGQDLPMNGARFNYSLLWDSLYGKGAWEQNPWIWAVAFQPIAAPLNS
ncbi:MAG: hypothetical protein E6G94_01230 [Alphaproteobacteria bacterium]|nr:MAG: hypothetical protein E6G94_01230 [Alphaproteobacteria bacterium]